MLAKDLIKLNLLVVWVVATTAAAADSTGITERVLTIYFRINGLVTLTHLARQSKIPDFQKNPYVLLLNMNGARYFRTSLLVTLLPKF